MPEQVGDRIDFTVFEPGTTHPTRGFPIGRCDACGKPGVVLTDEDGATLYKHYATVGEHYLSSTMEEVCEVAAPQPTGPQHKQTARAGE